MATSSNSALDNVLTDAAAAAENFQAPVVRNNTIPAAANEGQMGALAKPSMDNFIGASGMSVDEYLTSKAEGFRISKDMKGLLDEIVVTIDMLEVIPVYVSSHETGGQTKFLKSYDGMTTPTGQNYEYARKAECARNANNKDPYKTVEIPVTLFEDVRDPKSPLILHEGTVVGITPSMTGFSHFEKFYKKLLRADPANADATIKVKVSHTKRTNSRNNEWGVVDFELLEVISL